MTPRNVVIGLLLLTLAGGAGAQSTFGSIVGATQCREDGSKP